MFCILDVNYVTPIWHYCVSVFGKSAVKIYLCKLNIFIAMVKQETLISMCNELG